MDIQTLFPIYLPQQQPNMSPEDYSAAVGQNENNINQNFEILYNALTALAKDIEKGKTNGGS